MNLLELMILNWCYGDMCAFLTFGIAASFKSLAFDTDFMLFLKRSASQCCVILE